MPFDHCRETKSVCAIICVHDTGKFDSSGWAEIQIISDAISIIILNFNGYAIICGMHSPMFNTSISHNFPAAENIWSIANLRSVLNVNKQFPESIYVFLKDNNIKLHTMAYISDFSL